MARGLDVGTMNLIAARQDKDKAVLTHQRNQFVEVEYSDVAEKMLARSKVLHIRKGEQVYIVGEDAMNFANIFNKTTRRPMSAGILSRDEKSAIPMVRLIIERLLGRPKQPGEIVHFTSPSKPVDASHDVLYHQKTIESILRKLDYEPKVINEGMAAVYSELADNQFTGMGISFGAGMTNVCLAYYGVPVMTMSVARGGDWIDRQVSEATGWTKDKVCAVKERQLTLTQEPPDEVQSALSIYYDSLLDYTLHHIGNELRKAKVDETQSIPVVVTGGTSAPAGFSTLLRKKLMKADFPCDVESVHRAKRPLYSVALGALVGARADEADSLDIQPAKTIAKTG